MLTLEKLEEFLAFTESEIGDFDFKADRENGWKDKRPETDYIRCMGGVHDHLSDAISFMKELDPPDAYGDCVADIKYNELVLNEQDM